MTLATTSQNSPSIVINNPSNTYLHYIIENNTIPFHHINSSGRHYLIIEQFYPQITPSLSFNRLRPNKYQHPQITPPAI